MNAPADTRHRLTRALVLLVLVAAVATAPLFLFAEGFEPEAWLRVGLSNGTCAVLCAVLLGQVAAGRTQLAARVLVFGLLALVTALASSNGEPVHVNVINFVLVAVLASTLLGRGPLPLVGLVSAVAMVAIAWRTAAPSSPGEALQTARMEAIVQFLPTYLVIVGVLWFRERAQDHEGQTSSS